MDAAIFSLIAAIGGWCVLRWMRTKPSFNRPVPRVEFDDGDNSRVRYARESEKLIAKGYHDYLRKGQAFSMRNVVDDRRPLVFLPRKYLDEVKNAPENELSFPKFMENLSILRHAGGPLITDELCHATRTDLNRALPRLTQQMYEGCLTGCREFIPECPDWTSIMPYPLLLQIFNRIGQRVLVGPELARNQEWLDLTQNYTTSLLQGTNTVRAKYTPSLRWLAKYFERDVKVVYKERQRAAALLEPVLKSRLAARAGKQKQTDQHEDAIEWLIDDYHRKGRKVTAQEIAQDQLGLTLAAIHNTAATVLSTLYDLIDHPASLEDIRTEIRQTMEEHCGKFTRAALQSLRHLDSFMIESLRMHSMPQVTVQRLALIPKTFHDGFHIPAGMQVMFANRPLNHDPDVYPDPERFDPKRFYDDRDSGGNNKQHHFATVSDDSVTFGSGFHACPGRFFAQDVIKLLLASLLIRYDFKFAEEGQKRPVDMTDNLVVYPNATVPILIKELSF
ncbi:Cytochrome p450 [Apiospora saccharicola]|uniref:Cytochrome p450 n=1 Tax=Apiospora saccharicola TaxID=335842 RepID=A0ABR1USL0_9PEZI